MIALDTNILVHAHQRESSFHRQAAAVVREMAENGRPWAICYHVLVEFHGIVTRLGYWRLPSSPEQAWDQIAAWRCSPGLRILYDDQFAMKSLGELVVAAAISGPQVHDARIVACCLAHGVSVLWTVDRDFSRFPQLRTLNPLV